MCYKIKHNNELLHHNLNLSKRNKIANQINICIKLL